MKASANSNTQNRLRNAVGLSFAPTWLQSQQRDNEIIQDEIRETERLAGKERTKELLSQFKSEAYAKPDVVNFRYVISKLRETRESFKR